MKSYTTTSLIFSPSLNLSNREPENDRVRSQMSFYVIHNSYICATKTHFNYTSAFLISIVVLLARTNICSIPYKQYIFD